MGFWNLRCSRYNLYWNGYGCAHLLYPLWLSRRMVCCQEYYRYDHSYAGGFSESSLVRDGYGNNYTTWDGRNLGADHRNTIWSWQRPCEHRSSNDSLWAEGEFHRLDSIDDRDIPGSTIVDHAFRFTPDTTGLARWGNKYPVRGNYERKKEPLASHAPNKRFHPTPSAWVYSGTLLEK